MKKVIYLVVIINIIASCSTGTQNNYLILKRIMNSPDSLIIFTKDSSISSSSYIKYCEDIMYIEHVKNYINTNFKNNYTIIYNELLPYAHIDVKTKESNFNYYIHEIKLRSKIDTSFILRFIFIDENNNKKWKLDFIKFS